MTDTTVTTEAPVPPTPPPTPLPNDSAARSPTGEILDRTADQPKDQSLIPPKPADGTSSTDKPADPALDKDGKPVVAKPAEPGKVPDTYAAFKTPDNYTLDPKAVEAALPVFKELGLTQDQAQKLVDLQTAREIELAKAPTNAVETMRADWRAKVTADPELAKAVNGDKTGLDAVKLDIGRALTHLPAQEAADFKAAMDLTGAGDHPAFVKAFWKLSQLVTEGKHVNGSGPSPLGQVAPGSASRPTAGKALFPNLP
jgi:hypothetical protein